jgi:cation diffusion facilitator family transporter
MTADGFHSFSDGASNIVGLIGIWAASRPMDKEHPYGHKKYETFTGIIIATMLFLIMVGILRQAWVRIAGETVVPDVTSLSFLIMVITLSVNTGVMIYERKQGKLLHSDILIADSMHTKSDILVSVGVVITLISIKMGYPIVDIIAAVIIAGFIGHSAFEIYKRSAEVLCDMRVVPPKQIKNVVMAIEGIRECHKIRTRGRCDDIHLDLHILVDPKMDVAAAHRITVEVEKKLKAQIEGITDVVVHIEPHPNKHEKKLEG